MTENFTAKRVNGFTRVEMEDYYDDLELDNLYQWIDRIPLSRPKKNLGKDFSDGVLVSEVIKFYFPRLVELHNYTPASATKQKMENWYLLNRRVLRRLDLDLSDDVIRALANCKSRVVEKVLMMLRVQIDRTLERQSRYKSSPRGGELSLPNLSASNEVVSPRVVQTVSDISAYKTPRAIPHSHPLRRETRSIAFGRSYGAKPGPLLSDQVPRSQFVEKELECLAKDETIEILSAKIKKLEHLLKLKDIRIDDLESRLNNLQGIRVSHARERRYNNN